MIILGAMQSGLRAVSSHTGKLSEADKVSQQAVTKIKYQRVPGMFVSQQNPQIWERVFLGSLCLENCTEQVIFFLTGRKEENS